MNPVVIAVDFDGILCSDAFPRIGLADIAYIELLKEARKIGIKLILWTCRQDVGDAKWLTDAVVWCKNFGLEFDAVNENVISWEGFEGLRRKVTATFYLDDRAIGYSRSVAIIGLRNIILQERIKNDSQRSGQPTARLV